MRSSKTRNVCQYEFIYENTTDYGNSSVKFLPVLLRLLGKKRPKTILDFGCGKSTLIDELAVALKAKGFRYDPAIPEFMTPPVNKTDLVINTDVLEHLFPDEVDNMLADILEISEAVFFNISLRPAQKILPNGENAHATVRSRDWWRKKLSNHFATVSCLPSRADEALMVTWHVDFWTRRAIEIDFGREEVRRYWGFWSGSLKRRVRGGFSFFRART